MTYNEFFDYVFSEDFMKEGVIYLNNNPKYKKIFEDILNEEFKEYYTYILKECGENMEYCMNPEKYFSKKFNLLIEEEIFPDISNFPYSNIVDDNHKINNIIYYDVNVNYLNSID